MQNNFLSHPITRGKDIDDPQTTISRRKIIQSKPFFRKLYFEWYLEIKKRIPTGCTALEIGSGAGFFQEATRCVKLGGCIVMIEPWNTSWAKWVYQNLHSEPFDPDAGWTFPSSGPLSNAMERYLGFCLKGIEKSLNKNLWIGQYQK